MNFRLFIALISISVMESTSAFATQPVEAAPDCLSVNECISLLREHEIKPPPQPDTRLSSGIDPRPIKKAIARLVSFGDEAVVALIELFDHPNYYVQNRAAYALFHFAEIDPRHLPTLIAAHKRGTHWLIPAIAATNTDEALAFLWVVFLADADESSNSQVFRVLPEFGDRLHPYMQAELENCRVSDNYKLCGALLRILFRYDPLPAYAVPTLEAIATSQDASEGVRRTAIAELIGLRHPYGLVTLKSDLESALATLDEYPANAFFPSFPESEDFDGYVLLWGIEDALRAIAGYGIEANALGPLVTPFLERRDLRDIRNQAALTIGQIGFQQGVDALLAQRDDFADDWYLAYNVVESLGRLRAESARSAVETIMRDHWYKPVRNNAERALAFLDGGEFARPGVVRDGAAPSGDDQWSLTGADFRYQGDLSETPSVCSADKEKQYKLFIPRRLAWPRTGGVSLNLEKPTAAEAKGFFSDYPKLRELRGELEFAVEFGNRMIAGLNAGEFGGGVYTIDRRGRIETLIPDNAIAAFKTSRSLFVATGLSHLGSSSGEIWVINLKRRTPVLRRRIHLPLEPHGFEAAYRETLIMKGERGDVAIRSDGNLVDPLKIESCTIK